MALSLRSRYLFLLFQQTHRIYRKSFKSILQLQHINLSKCRAQHLCLSHVLQNEKQDNISDKEDTPKEKVSEISEELKAAAKDVAESLPGDPVKTHSQLLHKLQAHNVLVESQKTNAPEVKSTMVMENLFAGMKIVKDDVSGSGKFPMSSRNRQAGKQIQDQTESWKLFSGTGLGLFSKNTDFSVSVKKTLWDEINEETLHSTPALPSNAFEEMAIWTKEGKYWTFPINNEAGWEEEHNTGFHEHVFLQKLLTDFPSKGPIRHFMDLVITGLSMNPYLTVQQKKDHVSWFKNYFEEKEYMLKEEMTLK